MSNTCRKCNNRYGIPEGTKTTCPRCLEKQRAWTKQYHERRKTGTVGKMGRPAIAPELPGIHTHQAENVAWLQALPSEPPAPTEYLIEPILFARMAMYLEQFMPSRQAEALLHGLLQVGFARAGDAIKKVASE